MVLRSAVVGGFIAAALSFSLPAYAAGDAQAGAALVKARCQMCHVLNKGQKSTALAPNLNGVIGRKAGSTGDFALYSPALKASNIVWTPAKVDTFLQAPGKMVPGTKMVISVADAKDRANIVAFLAGNK